MNGRKGLTLADGDVLRLAALGCLAALAALAALDANLARAARLTDGNPDSQDAILEAGVNLVGIDGAREGNCALKVAHRDFLYQSGEVGLPQLALGLPLCLSLLRLLALALLAGL